MHVIRSRNPNAKRENPKIDNGFHYFDVVVGKGVGKQPDNQPILLTFHGSIGENTIIKKVGN